MVKKNSNFVPVQDLAGNFVMPEPVKKKRGRPPKKQVEENITMVIEEPVKRRGRPKKYSTAEEARKAKIANTIASAKKRKGKGIREIQKLSKRTDLSSLQNRLSPADVELLSGNRPHTFKTLTELQQLLQAQHDLGNYDNLKEPNQSLIDELTLRGEGLFSAVKNIVKKAKKAVVSVVDKVKDTASAVIYGRSDYPPKVRNIISRYGDKNITGIMLGRTPLGTPLLTALQVASGNTFSQKLENTPYDTLFHLFMCIELNSKDKITFEKNEVINAENTCKLPKETETKNITSSDIPQGLTLNEALDKTKERMGGKYFTYSAKDNNCQDFIVAFLTANNIGTETDKSWVKQETKVLFEGNDRLRKIANTLTDIGARVDVLRQGAGVKKKKGGMVVDDGYATPPPTIPLTAVEGNAILNAFNGATNQIRLVQLQNAINNVDGGDVRGRFRTYVSGFSNQQQVNNYLRIYDAILAFEYDGATDVESDNSDVGFGLKKKSNSNTKMANSWIEYVKAYAKKNNMKYNEALKDPKMKAGYKKGGRFNLITTLKDIGKKAGEPFKPVVGINPFTTGFDLGHDVIGPALMGKGMPTSRDEYISQLYDQANLGANGRVKLG